MKITSVGYPVRVDLGRDAGGTYTVYVDNNPVFSGESADRFVDIAPILRDYLTSERVVIDRPEAVELTGATVQRSPGVAVCRTETVAEGRTRIDITLDNDIPAEWNTSDTESLLFVANDYNNDCRTEFDGSPYITSAFVGNRADRRQIFFFGANTGERSMTIKIPHPQFRNLWRDTRGFDLSNEDIWINGLDSPVRERSVLFPGFFHQRFVNEKLANYYVHQKVELEDSKRYTLSFILNNRSTRNSILSNNSNGKKILS